mgnify:CR=1 FL=1
MESMKLRHKKFSPMQAAWGFAIIVLLLSACAPAATTTPSTSGQPAYGGGYGTSAGSSPTATSASIPVTGGEATLAVASNAKLGDILVDGKGMTLYMFTNDKPDQSNCSAGCLQTWPPFLSTGAPKLGSGVDASLVGSATLADGSKIVTYNHMPLYTFSKDTKPGDTIGQGIGNVWYAVSPQGKPVGMQEQQSTPAAGAGSASEATVDVATNAQYGKILVDGQGRTLYVFANDQPDKSNCSGQCLVNWPALVTQGHPKAGYGVDASMIGSATLADGSKIVTYNHKPLYTFAKDSKPGDINGQGVGSVWFMMAPDGSVVNK